MGTEAGDWIPLAPTDPMDEVVGRVRGKVAPDGRAWLPCDLDGNTIPEVSDDLTKLLAAYQSVRSENARLATQVESLEMCANAKDDELKAIYGAKRRSRTGGTE